MEYTARTWVATVAVGWAAFERKDDVFAILQKVQAGLTAMIEVLKEDPIFQTGYPWVDSILAFLLYVALVAASCVVLRELLDAWVNASKAESESTKVSKSKGSADQQPRQTNWRAIKLFLLSAVLVFIFDHTLRFKHRSIKLSSFKLKQEWHDMKTSLKGSRDFSDYLPDGDDVKSKAYQYAYGKLPDWLVKKIPWLPHDWSRSASV